MVTENVLLIGVFSVMVAVLVGPCYSDSDSDDGRYSRSANEAKIPSAGSHRQFRIAKLEQIWTKAHRMGLSPVRLAELHADLRLYEVEHLAWKHSAEREEKPSPDFKLHAILGRYGLDGRKRDAEILTNRVADNWDGSTEGEIVFADPKLEKLWMKAHNSHRFDHEELNWLRKEFEHQQQKMDELRSLSRFLSHMNDAPLNVLESGEQTVSPNYLALQEELQQRNHDVEEGLSRLGKLVFLGYTKDNKFREPSVRELWMKAQIMNLSLPDLQAFENELSKLENLMDKRSHMVQRLQVTGEKLRMSQQSESAAILQEKHMTLLEQTRDLAYKAKKHLQSLSSRLTNTGLRHNEL